MKKKDLVFTMGLTILMGVLWIVGEVVMGLWIPVVNAVHIIWLTAIIFVTLGISVWHSFIEDESYKKSSRQAKYERKTAKNKKRRKK